MLPGRVTRPFNLCFCFGPPEFECPAVVRCALRRREFTARFQICPADRLHSFTRISWGSMKTFSLAAVAVYLLCTNSAAGPEIIQSPKEVVTAFYREALMDFKPKEAFARYAAPDFVEHSADSVGGTTQSTIDFLLT